MFFDNPEFDKPLRPDGKPGRYPGAPPRREAQFAGAYGTLQFYELGASGLSVVVDSRARTAILMPTGEARGYREWSMR